MTFLPAESFNFDHRHSLDSEFGKSILDFLEFEWFDYCFDLFHVFSASDYLQSGPKSGGALCSAKPDPLGCVAVRSLASGMPVFFSTAQHATIPKFKRINTVCINILKFMSEQKGAAT